MLNAWCNGSAGIALARLYLRELDSATITEELEIALASVYEASPAPLDSICCGNFGRIDIAFEASRTLEREHLQQFARQFALTAVESAARRATAYHINSSNKNSPEFFTGLSGIGYSLLRMVGKSNLPCVLALE